MSVETVTLSNGDVVEIKPLTMRQAKACGLTKILNKIAENVDEQGNINISGFEFDEDTIIRVVKQVYPKVEDLSFREAFELFGMVVSRAMEKN